MTSDKAYAVEQRLNALGLYADAAGFDAYTGGDTTSYILGQAVTPTASAVTLTNTGMTSVFGGMAVAAANYLVSAHLIISLGATGTALTMQLTGPAVGSLTNVKWWLTLEAGTGQSMFCGHSLGNLNSVTLPSGTTMGSGAVVHVWMSAYMQFTAASGTLLNLQAQTTVASATTQVTIGSTLEKFPVS